jgi:DNA-binding transcriptional regulator GbsR (MarR family)
MSITARSRRQAKNAVIATRFGVRELAPALGWEENGGSAPRRSPPQSASKLAHSKENVVDPSTDAQRVAGETARLHSVGGLNIQNLLNVRNREDKTAPAEERTMDRLTAIFVDGIGAAAATSGILTQLQGRIFGRLYLESQPMSLDDVAAELEQSKSNISVNIRGLVEWHLVRRVRVGGSRKDHYEAATDFWRLMQEVLERRYRFNVRQVLVAVDESSRASQAAGARSAVEKERAAFVAARLEKLRSYFAVLDAGIAAFTQGKPLSPETLQQVPLRGAGRGRDRG